MSTIRTAPCALAGLALAAALVGAAPAPAQAAGITTATATFVGGSGNYLTTPGGTDNLRQVSGQETFSQAGQGTISVSGSVSGLVPNTVYVTVPYVDGSCIPAAGVTAFPSSSFTTDANGSASFTATVNPKSINPLGNYTVSMTRSVSIRQVLVNGVQVPSLPIGTPTVPNVGAVESCDRQTVVATS